MEKKCSILSFFFDWGFGFCFCQRCLLVSLHHFLQHIVGAVSKLAQLLKTLFTRSALILVKSPIGPSLLHDVEQIVGARTLADAETEVGTGKSADQIGSLAVSVRILLRSIGVLSLGDNRNEQV